jgi:hypothetical protein
MPELPDVEGFRRQLADTLPGRQIRSVDVLDSGVLRNANARSLSQKLTGHRFDKPRRHGKWLILPTDGPTLLVHSGMTGHPYFAAPGGEIRYADLRKLRGVWLADDDDELAGVIGEQGPDALALDLLAGQGESGAFRRRPRLGRLPAAAQCDETHAAHRCAPRLRSPVAAMAYRRARRPRSVLSTLRLTAEPPSHRRPDVAVVPPLSTGVKPTAPATALYLN